MKNDIIRCTCVDMSEDGQGITRSGNLVVFVKGMIKGEIADVRIIKEKKNYSIGIIEKLIEESPYRIKPDCTIAYKCGGCDYRHIDYDYQLKLKKEVLDNTFKGYTVEDITPCINRMYYRNKVQVPIRDNKMGFYRKNSNDIVEFEDCFIESKIANQIINDLKSLLNDKQKDLIRHILIKHASETDEVMLAFIVRSFNIDLKDVVNTLVNRYSNIKSVLLNLNQSDSNVILGTDEKILYGNDYIFDTYDGIKIKLSLKSFYQINHEMMLKLYAKVNELADVKNKKVLDLYCGIGTISLYLARFAKEVTGVEIVKEAIDNANDNAKINNIDNCNFILADASKNMDQYLINKDVLIVDPPRKGISKELIDSIIRNDIKEIVYVSCNPATLKRDLDLLKNHYNIGVIYPYDLFPYTVHVETVVKLSQKHIDHSIRVELDLDGFEETPSELRKKSHLQGD